MTWMKAYALWLEEIDLELTKIDMSRGNFQVPGEWLKTDWFKEGMKPCDVAKKLIEKKSK